MKKIIKTENAPKPIGPYNQAVIAGNYLFISGQIALNPKSGELITDEIKRETTQVMENLKAILSEASLTFENVNYERYKWKYLLRANILNETYKNKERDHYCNC